MTLISRTFNNGNFWKKWTVVCYMCGWHSEPMHSHYKAIELQTHHNDACRINQLAKDKPWLQEELQGNALSGG